MLTRFPMVFYNIGPFHEAGRDEADLERELHGMTRSRPEVVGIGLCETAGWGGLPTLPGFYPPIRDRSTQGRANVSAYLSRGLRFEPGSERWHDRKIQWERTEHDSANESRDNHPARSDLEVVASDVQFGFAHQPPAGIRSIRPPHDWITDEAQQEGIDLWTARMAPWTREDWDERSPESKREAKQRLRMLFWDPNRDPHAPLSEPGPHMLAHRIGGHQEGTSIEGCVVRGGHPYRPRKQRQVGGVKMGSDHKGAFLTTVVKEVRAKKGKK